MDRVQLCRVVKDEVVPRGRWAEMVQMRSDIPKHIMSDTRMPNAQECLYNPKAFLHQLPVERIVHDDGECVLDKYVAICPTLQKVFEAKTEKLRAEYQSDVQHLNTVVHDLDAALMRRRERIDNLQNRIDDFKLLPWYSRIWAALTNKL